MHIKNKLGEFNCGVYRPTGRDLPTILDLGVHHLRVTDSVGSPSLEAITNPSL